MACSNVSVKCSVHLEMRTLFLILLSLCAGYNSLTRRCTNRNHVHLAESSTEIFRRLPALNAFTPTLYGNFIWDEVDEAENEMTKNMYQVDDMTTFSLKKALESVSNKALPAPNFKKVIKKIIAYDELNHKVISRKSWSKILECTIKRKHEMLSLLVLKQMLMNGTPISSHYITIVLGLACDAGLYDESLSVMNYVIATTSIDITVHNFAPLLKSCGSCSRASDIFRMMEFVGLVPNVISYTAAIKSCELTGDWQSALKLLELMKAHWITPNERTYVCVISAASKGYAGNIAFNMLREMLHSGCSPNELCYGSALTACARCDMWMEVELLLNEMPELNVPLSESVLLSVINVCRISSQRQNTKTSIKKISNKQNITTGTIRVKESIFNDMQSWPWQRSIWLVNNWAPRCSNITESIFTMAMDVCERYQKYDEIINLYHTMTKNMSVLPSKSSFSYVLRACNALGNFDGSVDLATEALDKLECGNIGFSAALVHSGINIYCASKRYDLAIKYILNHIKASKYTDPYGNKRDNRVVSSEIVRQVLTGTLLELTRKFSTIYTRSTTVDSGGFNELIRDTTELLNMTAENLEIYFASDAYPMAAKLLLEGGHYVSLRGLLNTTLYRDNFNYTRLYEFVFSNFVVDLKRNNFDAMNILNFLHDLQYAGKTDDSVVFFTRVVEKAKNIALFDSNLTSIQGSHTTAPTKEKSTGFGSNNRRNTVQEKQVFKLGAERDPRPVVDFLRQMWVGGRLILGKHYFPASAYATFVQICKEIGVYELFLEIYKTGIQDDVDVDQYREILVTQLAKILGNWNKALSILLDIKILINGKKALLKERIIANEGEEYYNQWINRNESLWSTVNRWNGHTWDDVMNLERDLNWTRTITPESESEIKALIRMKYSEQ